MKAMFVLLFVSLCGDLRAADKPVLKDYPMREIPQTDPRFQAAYQSVLDDNSRPSITPLPEGIQLSREQRHALSMDPVGAAAITPDRKRIKCPVSLLDFVERLQMGEVFIVEKGKVLTPCAGCNGAGKIPITGKGPRSGDGKRECEKCHGEGKINTPQFLFIHW